MLLSSLFFVLQSVADIFAGILLLRFLMQWARVPFRNPIGQFVMAATDWIVIPVRKIIPGLWGLDMPSLILAWFTQATYFALVLAVGAVAGISAGAFGMVALVALIEAVRLFLYLIFGIVLVTAIMSWVNPYAPMAPILNALARPFLAPFQRFIPPLGGVDLSPLVLIIVVQLLLSLLGNVRLSMLAFG